MLKADQAIRCHCGRLQGTLSHRATCTRASCYCRDCQAYAHALGHPERVLDAQGGTDIVASVQHHVTFTQGADSLACLSLTEGGLMRWYAGCCNTPIANTARSPKVAYVGLVHTCLADSPATLDVVFGPRRMALNTKHAKSKVEESGVLSVASTMARVMRPVLRARVLGSWKHSPFFDAVHHEPVVQVRVLRPEELAKARQAV